MSRVRESRKNAAFYERPDLGYATIADHDSRCPHCPTCMYCDGADDAALTPPASRESDSRASSPAFVLTPEPPEPSGHGAAGGHARGGTTPVHRESSAASIHRSGGGGSGSGLAARGPGSGSMMMNRTSRSSKDVTLPGAARSRKQQQYFRKEKGQLLLAGYPIHAPVPEIMRFESWYYEGNYKHFLHINFITAQEVFQVYVDDDVSPFSMVIVGRTGLPMTVWDLHVGAVLDVLGKVTTLKRAAMDTQTWLDAQARFMHAHIEALKDHLSKFRSFRLKQPNPMERQHKTGTLGGKIRLRSLATIIDDLNEKLEEFRF